MTDGWKTVTLGDVAKIMYGKDHKQLSIGTIPVYGSGGLMRYADQSLSEDESILIPRNNTYANPV